MNKLTQLALSLSFSGLILTTPAAVFAEVHKEPPKAGTSVKQKASFLFVLRAEKGSIIKTTEGYEIILHEMDPKVLYFSDRPVRKAGLLSLANFMKNWGKGGDSFDKDPPNASLTHADFATDKDGVSQDIAVELSHPVAISDDAWKFKVKALDGKMSIGDYHGIVLFIDDSEITYSWKPHF